MNTAIAIGSRSENAIISNHFGQCEFFLIYDDESMTSDFIENPGKRLKGCIGEVVVKSLADLNVKRVIAGDFGTLVQQLLNANRIQMILYPEDSVSVKNIITMLNKKNK
jgi:predicted Fe-Mo cluster-binding NifX family protein